MFKKLLIVIVSLGLLLTATLILADQGHVCIPIGPCTYYVTGSSSWLPGGSPSGTYPGEPYGSTAPNPVGIEYTQVTIRGWKAGCVYVRDKFKCPTIGNCGTVSQDLIYADANLNGVLYYTTRHKAYEGVMPNEKWYTSASGQHSDVDAYEGLYGACQNRVPDPD
jgi:hypothetical protein